MARNLRLDLPGIAQHILQRGVNRSICFGDDEDREFYLASLLKAARRHECGIHAYVLMSNHVHLLVTGKEMGGPSSMMQSLGRRYVRHFNDRHRRTGTLWEGRFKSSLVDSEGYVLTCYRYIELNPVRAGMVAAPHDHGWSSVHANAAGTVDELVTPHPVYLALAADSERRLGIYRAFLSEGVPEKELSAIRLYLGQGKALGPKRFRQQVQALTGRSAFLRPPGRPPKPESTDSDAVE